VNLHLLVLLEILELQNLLTHLLNLEVLTHLELQSFLGLLY
jgi:hypothetical protein